MTQLVRIFLSGPGDILHFKKVVARVVSELNREWGEFTGVILDTITFETEIHGGAGSDAQSVINEQLPRHEVFLGLMWGRFGTPTPRAGSGTEEEFDRAYARFKRDGQPDIRFYFCGKAPENIYAVDPAQMTKIREFRSKLGSAGVLYTDFADLDDFESRVRFDLTRLLQAGSRPPAQPEVVFPESLRGRFTTTMKKAAEDTREAAKILLVHHQHMERIRTAPMPDDHYLQEVTLLTRETDESAAAIRTRCIPMMVMASAMSATASHYPSSDMPPEFLKLFEVCDRSVASFAAFEKTLGVAQPVFEGLVTEVDPEFRDATAALAASFVRLRSSLQLCIEMNQRVRGSVGPSR